MTLESGNRGLSRRRRKNMGCNDCVYCLEGLRDDNDEPCTACELMPSNDPAGCGYKIIDGIDHTKERMWFCPLKEEEYANQT